MRLSGNVYSRLLGMDVGLSVILPENIAHGEKCRVIYLLHGMAGTDRSWLDYSMLAARMIGKKTVVIMPSADRSFYTNMAHGPKWFDFIARELPEICGNLFPISQKREDTAVMGCSMGGYGALKIALSNPERYGFCGAFSSCNLFLGEGYALYKQDRATFVRYFGELIAADIDAVMGDEGEIAAQGELMPLVLAAQEKGILPKLYLSCGTKDDFGFHRDHDRFDQILTEKGIPHIYEKWEAGHDFPCFDEALKRALEIF